MSIAPQHIEPSDWPLRRMVDAIAKFLPELKAGRFSEHRGIYFWRLAQYPMYDYAPLPEREKRHLVYASYHSETEAAVAKCGEAFDGAFEQVGFDGSREENFERLRKIIAASMGSEAESEHRFERPIAVQILEHVSTRLSLAARGERAR